MTRIVLNFGLCLALCGALAFASSQCRKKNARYASADQCDAYTECVKGVATEKLCSDGLQFIQLNRTHGECRYTPLSKCVAPRTLQPAQPSKECPRQFGLYRVGNNVKLCGHYKNCAHGVAVLVKCPEGLAFNTDTYQCDFADQMGDCDAENFLGFTCPPVERTDDEIAAGHEDVLRRYPKEDSCNEFYICVQERPRLNSCGEFMAYNKDTQACDFYRNQPECLKKLKDPELIAKIDKFERDYFRENDDVEE